MRRTRHALGVGFSAIAVTVATLQEPRAIVLRPPDATLSEPFTQLHSIRELADQRVLISDNSSETRLVIADLRRNTVRTLGHQGSGPGEYRLAGRLFALTHDSTLFVDAAQGRRLLLLAGDSIVRTLPPDDPAVAAGDVFGADTAGHVLGLHLAGSDRLSGDFSRIRNVAVLASRRGVRPDTIMRLRSYDQHVSYNRTRTFSRHRMLNGSAEEQVQLFPDGWISIVRVEPYRVEWREPGGTIRRGPDLPWEAPRSDAPERRAFDERYRRRYPERSSAPDLPWADRLAPIRAGSLGTPEGHLLIARSQWSRVPDTQYDLVDRGGRLTGRLAMPDSERVVGFGPRTIYIAVTDGDGFQRLRRHPWP